VGSEDAVEIVRVSLALAFPTASAEGLTRAADAIIRWGAEDVAEHLTDPLTMRMLIDLLDVAGVRDGDFHPADSHWAVNERTRLTAPSYRTWSRTEGMDEFVSFLRRPPDEPPTPFPDPPDPGGPRPDPGAGAAG
jgi:hypothetical protein